VQAVEQQRGYPDDGEQRWYGSEPDWDRGRHGAPPPAPEQRTGGYGESTGYGDDPSGDGYEPPGRYAALSSFGAPEPRFTDPVPGRGGGFGPRSGEHIPPLPGDPPAAPGGADEPARRSIEAIDVAALRQSPAGLAAPAGPAMDDAAGIVPGFAAPDYPRPEYPPPGYVSSDYPPPDFAPPPEFAAPPAPSAPNVAGAGTTYAGASSSAMSEPTGQVGMVGGGRAGMYRSRRPAVLIALVAAVVLFEVPALRLLIAATFANQLEVAGTVAGTFLVTGLPVFALGLYALLAGAAAAAPDRRAWLRAPLVYLPVGVVLFVCAAIAAA